MKCLRPWKSAEKLYKVSTEIITRVDNTEVISLRVFENKQLSVI